MGRLWPTRGCCAMEKNELFFLNAVKISIMQDLYFFFFFETVI
jgi:hypothetical protein